MEVLFFHQGSLITPRPQNYLKHLIDWFARETDHGNRVLNDLAVVSCGQTPLFAQHLTIDHTVR